jgi:2-amino-4-hydroxy-6-hydroxymethyldihydropteridine diphosphokinase
VTRPTDHSPPGVSIAFVGVGSNTGDRLTMLRDAAERLAATHGVIALDSSPVYETLPVGPAGPGHFLNAVFLLTVRLTPMRLFRTLQQIESDMGRRPPRAGPRPIDLDLLFYDDLVFQNDVLTVPHPRVHCRAFVLRPLADLAPEFCHPESGYSVEELLRGLPSQAEVVGCVSELVLTE